jgi:glycosyltransferase involved in cell wall biosynthesis
VATYTQHILAATAAETDQKFVVLVQKEYDRPIEVVEKGRILIVPAFAAGLKMYPELLRTVSLFRQIKNLHIHSEFYNSGDSVQMALAIPFFGSLRVMGKKVTYFAHNVIDDFSFIAAHLGKKQQDLQLQLMERAVPFYYRLLAASVNQIVVLDESVKHKLGKYLPSSKILVTPHWIFPKKYTATQRQYWRAKYGYKKDDFVVVCFGFVTSYKGSDWLLDAITHLRHRKNFKNIKLILAGGKTPTQIGKTHYVRFYNKIAQQVAKDPHSLLTGFLKEEELVRFFAMADVVVLPYRGILGASGSWAQAMAYGKAFLLSNELADYTKAEDVELAMARAGLDKDVLTFKRDRRAFAKKLELAMTPGIKKKMERVATDVAEQRSPRIRLAAELSTLYSPQPAANWLEWKHVFPLAARLQAAFER